MPLSATVDGESVCGPLLSDGAWAGLRGRRIVLQPCGHRGFPRVSPLGTRHFVHARDSGCGHAESAEHLRLKADIAAQALAAGWQAHTEVPGPQFIADVLAEGDGIPMAFEVQRSRQPLHEYERRQALYEAAGIRCAWFVAHVPTGHQAGPQLPLFRVEGWRAEPHATVTARAWPLSVLVPALLSGTCQWRDTVGGRTTTIETLRQICPVCGASREVEVARWSTGACVCGMPVVRAGRGIVWPADSRCCGYWGPALTLGVHTRQERAPGPIAAGHWCLSV